jgi:hypothetical protein
VEAKRNVYKSLNRVPRWGIMLMDVEGMFCGGERQIPVCLGSFLFRAHVDTVLHFQSSISYTQKLGERWLS